MVKIRFSSLMASLVMALGNFTLIPEGNTNEEVSIKKNRSKKTRSTSGTISIGLKPYSSLTCLLNLNFRLSPFAGFYFGNLRQKVYEFCRAPLHVKDEGIDPVDQIVVCDKCRDRDH